MGKEKPHSQPWLQRGDDGAYDPTPSLFNPEPEVRFCVDAGWRGGGWGGVQMEEEAGVHGNH